MNREEFMTTLEKHLDSVSIQEKREIIEDYTAHFEAGRAAGQTEEAIASELGDPEEIAGMYKTELSVRPAVKQQAVPKDTSGSDIAKMVLVIIALLLFNGMIMLPFISTVLGIVISLFATAVVLVLTGLVLGVGAFFSAPFMVFVKPIFGILGLFLGGVAMVSFGVLMFIGMVYASKWLIKLLVAYAKFNYKLVKEAEGGQVK